MHTSIYICMGQILIPVGQPGQQYWPTYDTDVHIIVY